MELLDYLVQKFLNKVVEKYGSLPFYQGSDRDKDITFGEVALPNSILRLGHDLIDIPKNMILAVPAYDLKRGINYKKWPTISEKIIYLFKYYVYRIFSTNKKILRIYLYFLKKIKK